MTAVSTQRVTFSSDGVELAGELRGAEPRRPRPGVVFTGPFTGVKEQVVGTYALYDHEPYVTTAARAAARFLLRVPALPGT